MNILAKLVIATVCVATFATAYAVNSPDKPTISQNQQQWYVDENEDPIDPVGAINQCDNSNNNLCSDLFDMENGQPTTRTGLQEVYGQRN